MPLITVPAPYGGSMAPQSFSAKTPADYPAVGMLVDEFDQWVPGYPAAIVYVYRAGTTELAPLFSDITLTQELSNPQILISWTDAESIEYGKFAQSVYTPYAYETSIDSRHDTGIRYVPIYTLEGEDASFATVQATGATEARTLRDRAADIVWVEDYGLIGSSRTVNTATITAAIAAVSAQGGGRAVLPAGQIDYSVFSLPAGCLLDGQGRGVTVLSSSTGDETVTVTGDFAGLRNLTLDGGNLNEDSVGLYSENVKGLILDNVTIKRFETNFYHKGGQDHRYTEFYSENAVSLGKCYGEDAAFKGLRWVGGEATISTLVGIDFAVVDYEVTDIRLDIKFEDNVGENGSVLIYGATGIAFDNCEFIADNVTDIHVKVEDNPDDTVPGQVRGITFNGGSMTSGKCTFDGLGQDITFDETALTEVTLVNNVTENVIILKDCSEIDTDFDGDTLKFGRVLTGNSMLKIGQTTDATVTPIHKIALGSNETAVITAKVTAEQTNGTAYAMIFYAQGVRCAPGTLLYDNQTANFTVGDTITGATSGATAYIIADSDSGSSGTLSLGGVSGDFLDNETIAGATSGSAKVNGQFTPGDAATVGSKADLLSVGSNTNDLPAGWDVTFTASEQEISVNVVGEANKNITWKAQIDVTVL